MKKFIIYFFQTLIAVFVISMMVYFSSCSDEDYVTCDGSCSWDYPYSNSYTINCYQYQTECEYETHHPCKDCSD